MGEKTISEIISYHLIEMRMKSVQPEVKKLAAEFLADTFSCMMAGAIEKPPRIVMEYACSVGGRREATVMGTGGMKADVYHCAMVNGTAAHFHDYDDVCTTMIGHPSVAVLPAVLAVGESMGASGNTVLEAYITGIETCALMGRAFVPEHCKRGWHSTSSLGVFGATAAAARLLELNEEQLVNALGIAASESCGLKGNTGTMTKPLHAGRAASKGIMAAKLAKRGFTSNHSILEMDAGFIKVTTEAFHKENLIDAIESNNSEFLNVGLLMKPWPACKATHNGIWAMLQLIKKYGIIPQDIVHISCRVLPYAKDILRYSIVKTPTEGKFSMNYCIALIALRGRLTIDDFEGDRVDDSKVIDMMGRIDMVIDDTLIPGMYFHHLESTVVEVTLKDGRVLSERCDYAKGGPGNPMTRTEMEEKWEDCMARVIKPQSVNKVIGILNRIDKLNDIRILVNTVEEAVLDKYIIQKEEMGNETI